MENKLVSVVVPLYNSARFIDKTLRAVFSSSYSHFEVILIDDGSTDATRAVLEQKGWVNKVTYIYQENKGISASRNIGIKAANGKYISLLDHDDIPLPEKLSLLVDYLERHPEYKMVYTPVIVDNPNVEKKTLYPKNNNNWVLRYEGDLFDTLFHRNHIMPSSTLFDRQSMLDVGLFDETYQIVEDVEFMLRYSMGYKIGYVEQPLTIYSWRHDNTSRRLSKIIPEFEMRLYKRYYGELKKRSVDADRIFKQAMGNSYRDKAKWETKDCNYGTAIDWYIKAIQLDPMRIKNYNRLIKVLIMLTMHKMNRFRPDY